MQLEIQTKKLENLQIYGIKQHCPEQPTNQRRNQKGNLKYIKEIKM